MSKFFIPDNKFFHECAWSGGSATSMVPNNWLKMHGYHKNSLKSYKAWRSIPYARRMELQEHDLAFHFGFVNAIEAAFDENKCLTPEKPYYPACEHCSSCYPVLFSKV